MSSSAIVRTSLLALVLVALTASQDVPPTAAAVKEDLYTVEPPPAKSLPPSPGTENELIPYHHVTAPPTATHLTTTTGTGGLVWNRYTVLATVAASAAVAAGLFAVATVFFPLFAYKVCWLVGGCRNTLAEYVDQYLASGPVNEYEEFNYNNQAVPQQQLGGGGGASSTRYLHRQRRSLEYVGPILQTLAAAYEKYSDDDGGAAAAGGKKTSAVTGMGRRPYTV